MALTSRKKRPLDKDSTDFRDDRLFIVACDHTYAPKQYFEFFSPLLSRIQIHVVATEDNTSVAKYVLGRLQAYQYAEYDERWLLLDTDHCINDTHVQGFIEAIKEAKQQNIHVALSRPCFEIWLLLHHIDESEIVNLVDATQVEQRLRQILGEYNKRNLKSEHYPLNTVSQAFQKAKKLDQQTKGGDIPKTNTSRVYQLWENIIKQIPQSQLPLELHSIKNEAIHIKKNKHHQS